MPKLLGSQQEQIQSRGKADALGNIQIKFEMILPGELKKRCKKTLKMSRKI